MSRWRSTGLATRCTSANDTCARPSSSATALAASTSDCAPRTPAPKRSARFTSSGASRRRRIAGAHEARGVAQHRLGHGDVAADAAQRQHAVAGEHARRAPGRAAGGAHEDLGQLVLGRARHDHLEEEAIELRLGQRVGALHLDGVLGGEDEERLLHRVPLPAMVHGVLRHRLEQRALRLRRRAVDLVGQDDLPEDRPVLQLEHRPGRALRRVRHEHVGARRRRSA